MVKTATNQNGDKSKTATPKRRQNGLVKTATILNGDKSKRRQTFIANDKTVIECFVTESALNK